MSARSSSSVSNSLAARRQLVVERRQHLLLDLLHASPSTVLRLALVAELEARSPCVSPADMPDEALLELLDAAARHRARRRRRGCGLAGLARRDRRRRRRRRCAGRPSTGASSATALLQRLELAVDELRRAPRRDWTGTSSVVQSATSTFGCTSTVAVKLKSVVGRVRQLVVVLGRRGGPDARAGHGRAEPAADVALDRLARRCGPCRRARRAPASAPCPCGSRGSSGTRPGRTRRARRRAGRRRSGRRRSGAPCRRRALRRASPPEPFKQTRSARPPGTGGDGSSHNRHDASHLRADSTPTIRAGGGWRGSPP